MSIELIKISNKNILFGFNEIIFPSKPKKSTRTDVIYNDIAK